MSQARRTETLTSLAEKAGFEVEWTDAHGRAQRVPESALATLLERTGLPCASAAQIRESAAMLNAEQSGRRLPPLLTAETGSAVELPASAVRSGSAYRIDLESGAHIDGRFSAPKNGPALLAPLAEPGYHRLTVGDRQLTLAVAPPRCYSVEDAWRARHGESERVPALWGVAAQLYSLRRAGDGGIGDFTALATLAAESAKRGAQALAVSPTHAVFSALPNHFSPYAPSSRLWVNVAHIDPAAVFGAEAAREAMAAVNAQDAWQRLEAEPLIDWPRAQPLKLQVLRQLYDRFDAGERGSDSPRSGAFAAFCARGGQALEDHARFEAIHATMLRSPDGPRHWREWPEGLRDPRGSAVEAFAAEHRREVDFHRFLQWLAAEGLDRAQREAREAGMSIGLVADLAVGCDGGGSGAWAQPQDMLQGVSVGAPPDIFNQAGQSWGLTTYAPRALRNNGYGAFIDMLRAAFAHAGGVRIDHILGLRRLWLVPEGESAKHGAYLRYPFEDLLRLIALESWRHRAIVIGEDLGTVPPGLRERMAKHGLYGIRVLWFERTDKDDEAGEGAFLAPPRWDPHGMATTTTHDLPTIAGWWRGLDIEWRHRIGQTLPREDGRDAIEAEQEQRAEERTALWQALRENGCVSADDDADGNGNGNGNGNGDADSAETPPERAPVEAALTYVAQTRSPLMTCPLEDLLALEEQPNLPGSIDEHPNWRQRLPVTVDALYADAACEARVEAIVRGRKAVTEAPTGMGKATDAKKASRGPAV